MASADCSWHQHASLSTRKNWTIQREKQAWGHIKFPPKLATIQFGEMHFNHLDIDSVVKIKMYKSTMPTAGHVALSAHAHTHAHAHAYAHAHVYNWPGRNHQQKHAHSLISRPSMRGGGRRPCIHCMRTCQLFLKDVHKSVCTVILTTCWQVKWSLCVKNTGWPPDLCISPYTVQRPSSIDMATSLSYLEILLETQTIQECHF